ncbi:uncharacterized protein [Periplaneta americana]|uniref:uncharacterized protein isoform X2 n=1 Tax=Periplaneta americana TaxID=6978 RepID=UPI0037E7D45B
MIQYRILLAVVLVFAHHQGACWLESPQAPFSAVRHLSASRQLQGVEISPAEDVPAVAARPSRPLFSWDLVTDAPAVSSTVPVHKNNDSGRNADVPGNDNRKQRGKKLRKKKKKKEKLNNEDESVAWNNMRDNSSAPESWDPDNNVPGVWLTKAERRKLRNKMKKERDRTLLGLPDETIKKKDKPKSKDEKVRKEKKRRKEKKKKHRDEIMKQAQERKKEMEEERSNNFLPDVDKASSGRSKFTSKENVNNTHLTPSMPSSSENSVDEISGRYKKGAHGGKVEDSSSLEAVKNEINGEFSAKLFPSLHTSEKNDLLKPDIEMTTKNNNLLSGMSVFQAKTDPSAKKSSENNQKQESVTSENNTESAFTTERSKQWDVTEKNAGMEVNNVTKSYNTTSLSKELHKVSNTTELSKEGDLSCLSGTFLPAPSVENAEIKYMRGKFLEAEYECLQDYKLMPAEAPRLVCSKRQWLGEPPHCLPLVKGSLKELAVNASCGGNRGGCDQLCSMVENKPVCSCFRGFRLQGTTCHDIDECSNLNGGCEVSCHNKPGSFQCTCPSGYRLSANGKTCLDINECLLRNGHGPCQDSCRNLPGSYACSCEGITGTRLAGDNHTCEDLDECARSNAGCSHTCLNTLGRAFCLCPPGFMLGTDWKTCHDIDECADPELQEEEHCSIGCVNTVGSYHCVDLRDQAPDDFPPTTTEDPTVHFTTELPTTTVSTPVECLPGFEVGPFGSCRDIDECATGNGGCSHTCHNTLGSSNCRCPPGYMLGTDWKTCKPMDVKHSKQTKSLIICAPGHVRTAEGQCKDIDECAVQNGGCMQGCVNIRGSFRCICGRGFFLGADGRTCIEERMDIVCPPLPTPSYGYLHCTRRAFMVAPERWRARWRRRIVNHAGAVCELRCPHGYKVHGQYRKVCEANGIWAGPQDGFCMPFPKPKIECPENITMHIEPSQSTVFVAFAQPTTDVDWFRNVVSKPSWGKRLEADLPLGHWPVTFTARHPISRHTASCTLGITVTASNLSTEAPPDTA